MPGPRRQVHEAVGTEERGARLAHQLALAILQVLSHRALCGSEHRDGAGPRNVEPLDRFARVRPAHEGG